MTMLLVCQGSGGEDVIKIFCDSRAPGSQSYPSGNRYPPKAGFYPFYFFEMVSARGINAWLVLWQPPL
jgi:hypothetical protein